MWTQGILLASQDKIPDIANFSKNDNSKVINVLSDKLRLYYAHWGTQQPKARIREHKAVQMPQATLLENVTLANKDSSAKLPSQWGCESQTEAALLSALSECATCQLQPRAPACTESSMHRCHCVPVHTGSTQTHRHASQQHQQRGSVRAAALSCLTLLTGTAAKTTQGLLSSTALTDLQKWKLVFLLPAQIPSTFPATNLRMNKVMVSGPPNSLCCQTKAIHVWFSLCSQTSISVSQLHWL